VENRSYGDFRNGAYGQTVTTDLRPFEGMHIASPLYEVGFMISGTDDAKCGVVFLSDEDYLYGD